MSTKLTNLDSPMFGPATAAEPLAEGKFGFVKPEHEQFPPILIIAVTNLCDMACIHCAHPIMKATPGYRGEFMSEEVHNKIVEDTKEFGDKLWAFRYAADGESMLHPKFLDFVDHAKSAGIGPIDLTTNAMALTEEKMRRLLEAPIDVIDVSLDAYNKATYEKIRIRGKFDQVIANLKRLIELRDELGSPTKILTSIIQQKEALDEVDAFKEFWGQYVDEVLVRGLNNDLGVVEVDETYFDEDLARWPCHQFWKRVTINHKGEIRYCVEDWFNKGVVASILEHSIQEIWQSPMYTKFRELHMAGRWNDMKLCSKCMDWQHMRWDHGFEKAINKVLGKED